MIWDIQLWPASWQAWTMCHLYRPYRRQASFHRLPTGLRPGGIPVGAGLPAIGPVNPPQESHGHPCRPALPNPS
ncbi:hypothetical protein C6A77_08390 [Pseudomonas sp. AFG_SD02_1510_Pfu_092]|nr:hypothetical protein C6A77_08390 [Pseudomonas sp. AFG_SD02_1510_Pfu_092]